MAVQHQRVGYDSRATASRAFLRWICQQVHRLQGFLPPATWSQGIVPATKADVSVYRKHKLEAGRFAQTVWTAGVVAS